MDFHSLTRKELQALCKKNKIPANTTNISMADSLAALQQVEGLEELSNRTEPDLPKFPEDTIVIGSPDARPPPLISCRTSTRLRKPMVTEEPESSQPATRTRRATRRVVVEEADSVVAPHKSPAAPSSRRKAPLISVTKKTETRKDDEMGSVLSVRSTRRSVRLLEQNLEKLSLGEDVKIKPMEIDDEFSKEEVVNDSETKDEKEVSVEKIEEIQIELSNTVQEEVKDSFHETEEDSKSSAESESQDLVESLDENMVKNETLIEEVESVPIVELSNAIQNPDSEKLEAHRDVETVETLSLDPSCGKISTENLEVESESGFKPAIGMESESVVNLTSEEESSKIETTPTEISLVEDLIAIDNSGSGMNVTEFEAKHDSSEVEHTHMNSELGSDDDDDYDDESEESDFELVDVEVVEEQVILPTNDSQEKPNFVPELITKDQETSFFDVNIVQAEEINNKTPHCSLSGTKIGSKTPLPMSPFATNHLSGQFPRPLLSKSSSKSHPVIQMIANVLDENEEKIEVKNEGNENDDKNHATKSYEDLSLTELRRLLKTKLQIQNDKAENTRIALQTLSENLPKDN